MAQGRIHSARFNEPVPTVILPVLADCGALVEGPPTPAWHLMPMLSGPGDFVCHDCTMARLLG